MTLAVRPLKAGFAAELAGIDLRDEHDDTAISELVSVLADWPVCVVRHDRSLTDEEHIAFSRRLGPIEARPVLTVSAAGENRIPRFEIIDQSNLDETGGIYRDDDRRLAFKRANRLWHTDMSFHPVRATYSLLSAHAVPADGPATEFADMRAAWDALAQTTRRRIAGLEAEHSYWYSRVAGGGPEATPEELRSRPPAIHPLVHVRHGRTALYLASHASDIVGLPADEGRALLDELMAFATRPEFVIAYDGWRVGDVLIWDNLCTMHRARPFDDRTLVRDVRRTTCREAELPATAP